ncbi:MAG TPA: hypothetical protein VK186_12695, partial [Candidatus Deferrimicrobium sp.]|nr:hypothetical protein [Candidatus Deferrimicrobium sp.]
MWRSSFNDISHPESPQEKSSVIFGFTYIDSIDFSKDYVYMTCSEIGFPKRFVGLEIIDVSNPADPKTRFSYQSDRTKRAIYDVDISNPAQPVEVAYYETPGEAAKVFVNGDFVYVVDDSTGLLILKISNPNIKLHGISLDKTQLNFGATQNISTAAQDVSVHNEGTGTLHWNATTDAGWLTVSLQAGEGNGTMSVKVNPVGLSAGMYDGIVTITDPQAYNGPQEVNVTLKVFPNESLPPPFGRIDTPIDGSSVMNNIPVTGWVLHDMGVKSVKIYREDGWDEGKTPVCIGNAFFLAGSRPDIETAYPDYPFCDKAGWGYMVLTNLFPGGGNGQFTLHAVAQTLDGQQVTLGTKKIICDNAHSVIPFGDIFTPRQGRAVSSGWFENSAWVLTPLPNSIRPDGSTIYVFVDGVKVGHPIYNLASPTIAKLFPGYANSERARGYFDLYTAGYEEGLHFIQWVAIDSNRNMGGIGCRYFSIQGSVNSRERGANNDLTKNSKMIRDLDRIPGNYPDPIKIERGFKNEAVDAVDREIFPGADGICQVEIKELEHIEIRLGENITGIQGYLLINNQLRPLPIGSTLDAKA